VVPSQPQLVVNAAAQTLDRLMVPASHQWRRAVHAVDHHPQNRQKAPLSVIFQPAAAAQLLQRNRGTVMSNHWLQAFVLPGSLEGWQELSTFWAGEGMAEG